MSEAITFLQEMRELSTLKTTEKSNHLREVIKDRIRRKANEGYRNLRYYLEEEDVGFMDVIFKPLIEQGFKVKFERDFYVFKRDGFYTIKW